MKAEVVKEGMKKQFTIGDAVKLHNAMREAKVIGLAQEQTIKYLSVKLSLSDTADAANARMKKISVECLPDGVKEGDKVSEEVAIAIRKTQGALLDAYYGEPCDVDTHILTTEELFKHILLIDNNNDLTTENKAVMMRHLVKM